MKRPVMSRLAAAPVLAALMTGVLLTGAGAAGANQPAPPVDNPRLNSSCGMKVAVVLDESGSIGGYFGPGDPNRTNFAPQVRDAFRNLVDALSGTGSTMLVAEFADNGNTAVPPTAIDGNQAAFENYISRQYNPRARGLTGEFHTNWEAGLEEVRRPVQNGSFRPDLVIMLTDGEANKRYPWPGAPWIGRSVPAVAEDRVAANGFLSPVATGPAVAEAIDEANYLKAQGIRLFGVGVNLKEAGAASMARVAGATRWNGDPATLAASDYATYAEAGDLDNALALIGSQACSAGVTVNKFEERAGQRSAGAGWDFTVTPADAPAKWLLPSTGTGASRSRTTDVAGRAGFAWVTPASNSAVTVVETQRTGWSLSSVECTLTTRSGDTRNAPHSLVPGGFRLLDVDVGDKVSCDVVNIADGSTTTTTPTTTPPVTIVPPGTATTVPPGASPTTTTTIASDSATTTTTAPGDEVGQAAGAEPTTEVAGTAETNDMRPLDVLASATTPGLALTGAELPLPLAIGLLSIGAALVLLGRRRSRSR